MFLKILFIHSPSTVIMSYRRNDFFEIEAGAFEAFSNLREFYMEDISIENKEPGAFNGLANLKQISLLKNKLAHLDNGDFSPTATVTTAIDL
ncbi:hypothetical protein Trydic_g3372 [Trypoxylus dichotomus]